jgi:hypothetical protein
MLRGGGRRLARGRAGRRQWIILGRIRGYLTLTGRNTRSCKNKRIQNLTFWVGPGWGTAMLCPYGDLVAGL